MKLIIINNIRNLSDNKLLGRIPATWLNQTFHFFNTDTTQRRLYVSRIYDEGRAEAYEKIFCFFKLFG